MAVGIAKLDTVPRKLKANLAMALMRRISEKGNNMKYQRFLRRKVRRSGVVDRMNNFPNFVFIWKSVDDFGGLVGETCSRENLLVHRTFASAEVSGRNFAVRCTLDVPSILYCTTTIMVSPTSPLLEKFFLSELIEIQINPPTSVSVMVRHFFAIFSSGCWVTKIEGLWFQDCKEYKGSWDVLGGEVRGGCNIKTVGKTKAIEACWVAKLEGAIILRL